MRLMTVVATRQVFRFDDLPIEIQDKAIQEALPFLFDVIPLELMSPALRAAMERATAPATGFVRKLMTTPR